MKVEEILNQLGHGHQYCCTIEESGKGPCDCDFDARLAASSKLRAAEELHKAIEMDLAVVSNTVVLRYQQYEKAGSEEQG